MQFTIMNEPMIEYGPLVPYGRNMDNSGVLRGWTILKVSYKLKTLRLWT